MAVMAITPEIRELRERVRDLMDRLVYPNEARLDREDDEAEALVKELRAEVRAAGLWAPHIGPEAGGSGRGFVAYAFLNELIGRSAWAPLVFGCQAPDAGNAEILHLFGTPDQRRRWLAPLVAGRKSLDWQKQMAHREVAAALRAAGDPRTSGQVLGFESPTASARSARRRGLPAASGDG